MTLLDRIAARRCAHVECSEDRAPDAQLCPRHLLDLYRNLLDRDGSTYVPRRRFRARELRWAA